MLPITNSSMPLNLMIEPLALEDFLKSFSLFKKISRERGLPIEHYTYDGLLNVLATCSHLENINCDSKVLIFETLYCILQELKSVVLNR